MEEDREYKDTVQKLFTFIEESPSQYHAVDTMRKHLEAAGYEQLLESGAWKLKSGGKYYVIRSGSSLIAFRIPAQDSQNYCGFQIVASHSDSPSFKIKTNPEMNVEEHYVKLNVEKYGGMLCAPWFDRPLSVAGRLIVKENNRLVTKLVNVDRDLVMIPNLAIHMNREANKGYDYNIQKDMLPLYGCGEAKGKFMKQIAETANVEEDTILASDLFLYNRMKGSIWGACEEFISSPKLDDLQCAFSSLEAFLQSEEHMLSENVQANEQSEDIRKNVQANEQSEDIRKNVINGKSIPVHCVFDNEEVGSGTKQGAASTFLADTLIRINHAMGRDEAGYRQSIANSFMLSADNAHGVHPNHTDKACPTNRPYPGNGVVIKYSANQKYTTDAISAAVFEEICNRANVPYQIYVNRSDILGGSTLGNISTTQVPVNTVDIVFEASVRQTEDGYEIISR
ncbi:M18 family aminopeptidase [Dorea formicigenerans]|uniref:M18 family aminopeptidase n=1 Tax=Dorea formicigenerans TaxID=39486 RepID=UPI000E4520F0|nr:M18 family aminopeptidase [Dorea formicigenerans]RGJ65581.1 M18 family aminopeptidase [Dorea formicigenerans]